MKRTCLALTIAALSSAPAFAQTLTITQPNGGEQMCLGTTYQIMWTAVGITGNVRLTLFKGGANAGKIIDVPAVPGMYNWNVGQSVSGMAVAGADYTIRITTLNAAVTDYSNAAFTIKNAGECGGGATPTPTPGGGGGIDPGLLAKLKAMRVIEWKIPGPGPNPCLSCPDFDLGSLLDLVGNPVQPVVLKLLKNGQPIAILGTIGKGQSLGRTVSPRLSAPDFGLLKTRGAQFEIGVFSANGLLQHKIAVNGGLQMR